VLYPERDADDGDEASTRCDYVADCEPNASDQEPEDVANHSEGAGADILNATELGTADCFFAKGQECELPYYKAGLSPGNANNGDGTNQAGKPPPEAHPQTAKNEPQKVSDCSQFSSPIRLQCTRRARLIG
jgi:hypothetical protein